MNYSSKSSFQRTAFGSRWTQTLGKMKKRVEQLEGELFAFIKKYSRKAQRRTEPNDRRYDRKIEKWLKTAKPDELSKLLNQEEKNEDQS